MDEMLGNLFNPRSDAQKSNKPTLDQIYVLLIDRLAIF